MERIEIKSTQYKITRESNEDEDNYRCYITRSPVPIEHSKEEEEIFQIFMMHVNSGKSDYSDQPSFK